MAMVLLLALLLLGLPFLFTQTASMRGTEAYQQQRLAVEGCTSVIRLSSAVAAYSLTDAFVASTTPTQWSSLTGTYLSASSTVPAPLKTAVHAAPGADGQYTSSGGALVLEPSALGIGPAPGTPLQGATLLGARLEDESGKFNPNAMTVPMWSALLTAVGIQDWPDTAVYSTTSAQVLNYSFSLDSHGQLAQALANLRISLPQGRITDLNQLLQANPQQQEGLSLPLLRWPLTAAELDRLRPYLTLWNPAPGPRGLIDLGNVVGQDLYRDGTVLDCNPDGQIPLLGNGSVVWSEGSLGGDTSKTARVGVVVDPLHHGEDGVSAHMLLGEDLSCGSFGSLFAGLTPVGTAVMLEVPAPLNLHALPLAVRQCYASTSAAVVYPETVVTSVGSPLTTTGSASTSSLAGMVAVPSLTGAQPVNLFGFTYPLGEISATSAIADEWPPLGILSGGCYRIDASASVTDVLGRVVASDHRSDIVYAIPQEQLLESRWLTQGAFHQLVEDRFANHLQAWPVPYERLWTDATTAANLVVPDDVDLSTGSSPTTGTCIRPRPLPDLASVALVPLPNRYGGLSLAHCPIDWRVPFGANPYADATWHQGQKVLHAETLPPTAPRTANVGTDALQLVDPSSGGLSTMDAALLQNLQPDGYHITSATPLGYLLAPLQQVATPYPASAVNMITGFVTVRPSANVAAGTSAPTFEMDARHISFWVQATSDWVPASTTNPNGIYPLFEVRAPASNCGNPRYDYTPSTSGDWISASSSETVGGSNGSQNYLALAYDANIRQLILSIAPPSIEQQGAQGPIMVPVRNPADEYVDESTLGAEQGYTFEPLAPLPYADGGAALGALTPLFAPNRVMHCYYTPDDANGVPFFRKGSWHHIEVFIGSDRPEAAPLCVDGIAGCDVLEAGTGVVQQLGDHVTIPSVALTASLPAIDTSDPVNAPPGQALLGTNSAGIAVLPLTLPGPHGSPVTLGPTNLLPANGMVRIHDEYIRYDQISGNTLLGPTILGTTYAPLRGQRQDTYTVGGPNPQFPGQASAWFPATQAHPPGSVVTPGGYRVASTSTTSGVLYIGGCVLGNAVPVGDVGSNSLYFGQVWAPFDVSQLPPSSTYSWSPSSQQIELETDAGVANEFPNGPGIVSFQTYYFYYSSVALDQTTNHPILQGVQSINGWPVAGTPSTTFSSPAPGVISFSSGNSNTDGPPVILCSIYGVGPYSPATPGAYNTRGNTQGVSDSDLLLALMQMGGSTGTPNGGHVEWIRYTSILANPNSPGNGGFFFNANGFAAQDRGVWRTTWVGTNSVLSSPLTNLNDYGFVAGSRILPVQTEFGAAGHWIASGDVVTVLGHGQNPLWSLIGTPSFQATVRYTATDGFDIGNGPGTWIDAKNEYFCFTDALPIPLPSAASSGFIGLPLANLEFLCGTCWSGDDLSPNSGNTTLTPHGYLPRLDLWTDSTSSSAPTPGRVWFGTYDPTRAPQDPWLQGQNLPTTDMIIDGLCCGQISPQVSSSGQAWNDGEDDATYAPSLPQPITAACAIDEIFSGTTISDVIPDVTVSGSTTLSNLVGIVVHANTNLFPYAACGNMGLVMIDGEVFAYQRPTTQDEVNIVGHADGSVTTSSCYARLVARGLLGSTHRQHVIAPGPILSDGEPHPSRLPAVRIPVGPVLQLASSVTFTGSPPGSSFFELSDLDSTSQTPPPASLEAPAAMFCSPDGGTMEMLGLIGPNFRPGTSSNPLDPNYEQNQGMYITASWLRGLYNTQLAAGWSHSAAANDFPPIVIGCWPRYPSALPHDGLTSQHLRSRLYSWLDLPVATPGAYFDPGLITSQFGSKTAVITADDARGTFLVQVRALAFENQWTGSSGSTAMDWFKQPSVSITGANATPDASAAFGAASDPAQQVFSASIGGKTIAKPVDGAVVRVLWQYPNASLVQSQATPIQVLADAAANGASAPTIFDARIRYLAAIQTLARTP